VEAEGTQEAMAAAMLVGAVVAGKVMAVVGREVDTTAEAVMGLEMAIKEVGVAGVALEEGDTREATPVAVVARAAIHNESSIRSRGSPCPARSQCTWSWRRRHRKFHPLHSLDGRCTRCCTGIPAATLVAWQAAG